MRKRIIILSRLAYTIEIKEDFNPEALELDLEDAITTTIEPKYGRIVFEHGGIHVIVKQGRTLY